MQKRKRGRPAKTPAAPAERLISYKLIYLHGGTHCYLPQIKAGQFEPERYGCGCLACHPEFYCVGMDRLDRPCPKGKAFPPPPAHPLYCWEHWPGRGQFLRDRKAAPDAGLTIPAPTPTANSHPLDNQMVQTGAILKKMGVDNA